MKKNVLISIREFNGKFDFYVRRGREEIGTYASIPAKQAPIDLFKRLEYFWGQGEKVIIEKL